MTTTGSVRPASRDDFSAFYPPAIEARTLDVNSVPLAIGVLTRKDGRLWLAIDTKPGAGRYALKLVRAAVEMMKDRDEPVFALCQEQSFPDAPRLLRAIGFIKTDEVYKNIMQVWRWQNSGS